MGLPKVPQRIGPGFAFSMVGRCLQEGLGARKFGAADVAQVLAFFSADPPECVYCGSDEVRRWDHLVPVSKGGETVLGNMVPACARCDDARQACPFEEWMVGPAQWSPTTRGVRIDDPLQSRARSGVLTATNAEDTILLGIGLAVHGERAGRRPQGLLDEIARDVHQRAALVNSGSVCLKKLWCGWVVHDHPRLL